jgi:hypothetical protein
MRVLRLWPFVLTALSTCALTVMEAWLAVLRVKYTPTDEDLGSRPVGSTP